MCSFKRSAPSELLSLEKVFWMSLHSRSLKFLVGDLLAISEKLSGNFSRLLNSNSIIKHSDPFLAKMQVSLLFRRKRTVPTITGARDTYVYESYSGHIGYTAFSTFR